MKFAKIFRRKTKTDKNNSQAETGEQSIADKAKNEEIINDGQAKQSDEPDNKPSSPLEIVYSGHRGSGHNVVQYQLPSHEKTPENSLAAFNRALQNGVKSIEFDVLASKDGVLMVTHDKDLSINAVFNNGGFVQELPKDTYKIENYNADQIQSPAFDISYVPDISEENGRIIRDGRIPTGLHIKGSDREAYTSDYQEIPILTDLFDIVTEENEKRQARGESNIILNMELKGHNTGKLVKKELDYYNNEYSE